MIHEFSICSHNNTPYGCSTILARLASCISSLNRTLHFTGPRTAFLESDFRALKTIENLWLFSSPHYSRPGTIGTMPVPRAFGTR